MTTIKRTDSADEHFISLVRLLDADLAERDGADHAFYAQFNKTNLINHVIILLENNMAVACGAIKEFSEDSMEVKRMFTFPDARGKGLASRVLNALEEWAFELGYKNCVLETGKKQPEAINLYKKNGYVLIPNYGQYEGMDNSVCFKKVLIVK